MLGSTLRGSADSVVAANQMSSKMLRDIRQNLTARNNKVLLMYRRHCAAAVQAGQVSKDLIQS